MSSKYSRKRQDRCKELELEHRIKEEKTHRSKPSGLVPVMDSKGNIIGYEPV